MKLFLIYETAIFSLALMCVFLVYIKFLQLIIKWSDNYIVGSVIFLWVFSILEFRWKTEIRVKFEDELWWRAFETLRSFFKVEISEKYWSDFKF